MVVCTTSQTASFVCRRCREPTILIEKSPWEDCFGVPRNISILRSNHAEIFLTHVLAWGGNKAEVLPPFWYCGKHGRRQLFASASSSSVAFVFDARSSDACSVCHCHRNRWIWSSTTAGKAYTRLRRPCRPTRPSLVSISRPTRQESRTEPNHFISEKQNQWKSYF